MRLLASGEAPEQMLQVCEQDMSATDEAVSDLRGVGQKTSKRRKGEVLAHQHEGDTSGGCSDGNSGSVAELVVEGGQGPLQPSPRKRVSRGESALVPGG